MEEYDVLGRYIPAFVQHLTDTGARLGVGLRLQASDGPINEDDVVEERADAGAPSGWTPAEQDVFFRALSVHSRWRPDLIAARVQTKTEWEVWMYLEALEEGAATLAMEQGGEDVDVVVGGSGDERQDAEMQVDDGSSDGSDSHSDTDEDVCEPALEVSQAWVDLEERMAAWIVQEEHLASVEGGASGDTEDVAAEPRKRKRGRPRGTGKGCAQAVAEEQPHPPLRAYRSSPPRPSPTTAQRVSTLSIQRLMGHLEVPHLLVLDGILRESEEVSERREDSTTGATPTAHGDEGTLDAHDVRVPSPPDRPAAPQGTISAPDSNVVIDPVLLALSGDAGPGALAIVAPVRDPAQGPSLLRHASTEPASLQVPSQPGSTSVLVFPSGDTTHTPSSLPANAEPDLSLFSPRSRRRIQKRLYMRRKRAQIREDNAASEGAIDTGIQKLRPGKRAKAEGRGTPVASTSVARSEARSDVEAETAENMARKNKGGLTLPYKLKAQFAELGIDAAYLGIQGMDLLNLGALGRLMGLCSSPEHEAEEEAGLTMVQSIDAQLIQHLQTAMVSFVTDVAHRAIVWREREIRMKRRSQAWRQGNHITVAAIEHAVEAVDAEYRGRRAYFAPFGHCPAPANDAKDRDPANASFADPDAETADRCPERPRPHRDVYAPLIRPPPEWRVGALACFTWTYEREATRTRRGPSADVDEELLSDETDEEALEAELQAEDDVDALDRAQATAAERMLWEK